MSWLYRSLTVLVALAFALALTGCGENDAAPAYETVPERPTATAPVIADAPDGVRTIIIRPVGDEMRFEQTEITAEAGETIRVVYDNTPATSPAMMHNVVFITSHDEINRIGQAAMGAPDYMPDDPAVIAGTPLAGPGEIVEVTFTVPDEPGEYAYACTFAGHYLMMQGTLRVTPRASA